MNLRDLEYIVAVSELRNFSKAAIHCHVSQPTLSNQIRKLEEHLGVTLFERTNKRVVPTEAARDIIHSAQNILEEVHRMQSIAKAASNPLGGRFRLGAFPSLASYILPNIIPAISKSLPEIRLILVEEKTHMLIEQLAHGELDAALLALPVAEDLFSFESLFFDPFFLAVPNKHPFAKYTNIAMEELHRHPPMLLDEGHCLRDQALTVCRLAEKCEQDFRASSLETLRMMVSAGTGITVMPQTAMKHPDPGIMYIPFTSPTPGRNIGLVWRNTSPRKQVIENISSIVKRTYGDIVEE